ncbi:MAG: hypothetical protein KGJ93_00980 [Patescibacteria group bacterium]|nr:hypothetical protein [Patescibacteria group bacterium]
MNKTRLIFALTATALLAASCNHNSPKPAASQNQSQNQNQTTPALQPDQAAAQKPANNQQAPQPPKPNASGVVITPSRSSSTSITTSPASETHGYYMDYSDQALAVAKTNNIKIVLFFYSDSFAPCKNADTNLQKDPEKIPAQTVVLRVDWTTQAAVAKKYGAIAPLEFIQIDNNDKVLASWLSDDLSLLAKNIK